MLALKTSACTLLLACCICLPLSAADEPAPILPLRPAAQTVVELEGRTLQEWAKDLKDPDCSRRERAISVLPLFGQSAGTSEIVSLLLDRVDHQKELDASPRVRALMALSTITLSQTEIPRVVEALAKAATTDNQSTVRYYAVLGLQHFGEESRSAIPALVKCAKDQVTWEIRRGALNALSEAGRGAKDADPDARAITALLEGCNDVTAEVRLEAVIGLGNLGSTTDPKLGPQMLATLRTMASDKDKRVAVWALASQLAVDKVHETPILAIASYLKSTNEFPVRMHALRTLALLGPRAKVALNAVTELLQDRDPNMVAGAIGTLVSLEDRSPAILKLLESMSKNKDADWRLRHLSMRAMELLVKGSTKDLEKPPIPPPPTKPTVPTIDEIEGRSLMLWMQDLRHADPSVKERAIAALPFFGSPASSTEVITLLLNCMLDKNADASPRIRAVSVLSMLHIPKADYSRVVNALARCAEDTQSMVRFNAVLGLQRFGEESRLALTSLIRCAGDQATWEIRRAAVMALAYAGRTSRGSPDIGAYAAMLKATQDHTAAVRLEAAIGLGILGRASNAQQHQLATMYLTNLVNDKDKRVATWALVSKMVLTNNINDPSILKIADHLKSTNEVQARLHAARALGMMGTKGRIASDKLVDALQDKDYAVVMAVIMALTQTEDKSAVGALTLLSQNKEVPEGVRQMAATAKEAILNPKPKPNPNQNPNPMKKP